MKTKRYIYIYKLNWIDKYWFNINKHLHLVSKRCEIKLSVTNSKHIITSLCVQSVR